MLCPKCDLTMFEIDDCGDGSKGWECDGCGKVISEDDQPCPDGTDGEACQKIENEWGGYECLMCGREM